MPVTRHLLVFLSILVSLATARAQDTLVTSAKDEWHFLAIPYLMFPNMNGSIGLGDLPDASFDLNPGDIFSRLQIGGMLYFEAHNGTWAATSDVLYMKLTQDVAAKKPINSGSATMSQTSWELAGLYRINEWLEAGAGARLNNLSADAELKVATLPPGTETTQSNSLTHTWVDPILIARMTAPLEGNWLFELRADIGGFGIGSKLAWQIQADAGYKFSKLFQTTIGYRCISVDYETGSGADRFLYDVRTFGPVIRFGFNL